ncbi:hypothetical protein [Mycobacterium sp. 852002-51057_SCH5723018]|uniref:hypothetical protein n=1 Tax=Mycobacterium sp. 852002-51057_SCH5723018 TaxID=1834094 RepID=UPI00082C3B1E|nr:hypothetical protein [Mycobacterium sp. 852002-51057_SCH5723018]
MDDRRPNDLEYTHPEWVEAEECARRMGLTMRELDDLVSRGAVRARRVGWGVEYQPCVLNVTPRPEKPSPKRGTAKARPDTPRGRK